MYRRWLWPGFALPGVLWLLVLFVVPFYAVVAVAFGTVDPILAQPVPIWNPLEWNVGWIIEVLHRFAPGGTFFGAVRAHDRVRGQLAGALPADRLPRRLLHRAPCRPHEEPSPRAPQSFPSGSAT